MGFIDQTLELSSQAQSSADMEMSTMLGIGVALAIYVVAMSLIGEGPSEDERELHHRRVANLALIHIGRCRRRGEFLYQLFISHQLDYWLLIGLIGINLSKIVSLI